MKFKVLAFILIAFSINLYADEYKFDYAVIDNEKVTTVSASNITAHLISESKATVTYKNEKEIFSSSSSNDHGSGWERTYYEDGTPCDDRRFDWEVSGLDLYLFFDDRTSLYITDYSVTPDMFKGVFENGVPFVLYLERRW